MLLLLPNAIVFLILSIASAPATSAIIPVPLQPRQHHPSHTHATTDAAPARPFGRDLLQSRTRSRRARRSRAPRPPRSRRQRGARNRSRGSPGPLQPPPIPSPPPPPPPPPTTPPPPDNANCPDAPINLWINELVWRVNGDGEFIEVAGPPGVDSAGWFIGECDQGDGSERPETICRRALVPAPPLAPSGGLSIGLLEADLRTGTDESIGLINPCGQLIHVVVFVGSIFGIGEGEQTDNLESLDADFFPLGNSMSLTGQGAALSDFSFAVTPATPGAVNTGQNSGPPLPTLPTPPASCAGLQPLWINEIKQGDNNEEFWEVAAAPGADSSGWTMARCQESTSEGISRPIGCGTSRVPVPPLSVTASGLLIASETTTLDNRDSREQGLGLFNPCGELTQVVTFEGEFLREVDGVEAVVLEDVVGLDVIRDGRVSGSSFALVGRGSEFDDFVFEVVTPVSPGDVNPGQEFVG